MEIIFISPSTLDRKLLVYTIICVLLWMILGSLFIYLSFSTKNVLPSLVTVLISIFFIIDCICTPYKYVLTNSEFLIKRHFKDIVIPLHSIKTIRLLSPAEKKIRYCRNNGASGCFGLWGNWRLAMHNKVWLYVRRYNNWTLIETDREKYVIAPDDPQLIDAVAQQIGKTETRQVFNKINE